ncbi:MAG TPA: glycosyltransferase [Trebonia sp.]|nr:glycosyltransferase [Trebonia sp.]
MRVALVAGNDVADAEEIRGLAAALRDAEHQVSPQVIEAGPDASVRAAVPGLAASLRSAWSRQRPDVVHAFGWAGGLAAVAAARDAGLPVVTAFGSLAMTERRHGPGPDEQERARLERAIGAASRALIAASSEEAAGLVRMGVSRRRVHVVPAGVDVSVFTPDGPVAPHAHQADKADKAKPRIVTAAGIDDEQSATLARAMAALPGAELIACPPGASDQELAALLRSASLFVHVPAYCPRGTCCLKAMACGTPVVASAGGAHADMITSGTNGLLVSPGRPDLLAARIRHLLGHPLLREACGIAAADRAQSRYGRDRVTTETLAVYAAVAQSQPHAA